MIRAILVPVDGSCLAERALAIGAGLVMGRKLPQRTIGLGAACLFVLFGLVALVRGLTM